MMKRSDGPAKRPAHLTALRVGTVDQPVLGSSGDDHRANWGYAYAAATAAGQRRHRRRPGTR